MLWEYLRKRVGWFGGRDDGGGRLYIGLGPLEIALIVVAVVLVFGVGKLSQVGGALGKSIREFRKEKDGAGQDVPKLTTRDSRPDSTPTESEARPKEEKRD